MCVFAYNYTNAAGDDGAAGAGEQAPFHRFPLFRRPVTCVDLDLAISVVVVAALAVCLVESKGKSNGKARATSVGKR